MTTNTIEVTDLHKRYGDVHAVDGVSFQVAEGEFFGILGPNGAGKTTTLEVVEGLREPDSGTVTVLGERPWPRNPRLLPRIGVQLQASSFFERLTAREQIRTFASLYGVSPAEADRWLAVVGMEDAAGQPNEKLSGGQQQRLSIACALAHSPDLVFLDEPTSGLDPQARRNLWDVLREINRQGRTVVLTTHYMDEAEVLCDRVAIMDRGRILDSGAPAALVRGLDAPARISIASGIVPLDEANRLADEANRHSDRADQRGDRADQHGGEASVTDDGVTLTFSTRTPGPVLAALAARDALHGLTVRAATLEDVFLQLTGREYRE